MPDYFIRIKSEFLIIPEIINFAYCLKLREHFISGNNRWEMAIVNIIIKIHIIIL